MRFYRDVTLPAEEGVIHSGPRCAGEAAPLLNQTLVVFLVAMVLANMAGHMYEPAAAALPEEPERQRGAGGIVLHPIADHPARSCRSWAAGSRIRWGACAASPWAVWPASLRTSA